MDTEDVGVLVEPDRELVTYNTTKYWGTDGSDDGNTDRSTPGMNTIYLTNKPSNIIPNVTFDSSNNIEASSVLPGFSHTESTIVGFGLDEFWRDEKNNDEDGAGINGIPVRKRILIGLKNAYSYMNYNGAQMCTRYNRR